MDDILRSYGAMFLGSRLKRLGERLQAGSARVTANAGLLIQPSQIPLLAALGERAMTVGELAQFIGVSQPGVTRSLNQLMELDLVETQMCDDQRQRKVSLTLTGTSTLAYTKLHVLPRIEYAVKMLIGENTDNFLLQLENFENSLTMKPLENLAAQANTLRIREFTDEIAHYFYDINHEWISEMFNLEQADKEILENPRRDVVDSGGAILFVEAEGLGIVGTCALQKTKSNSFELTKMGVLKSARGLKAGEFLLAAVIQRAKELRADQLYLLSNSKCAAGIHLYEKLGFQHSVEIMKEFGERYERCNIAMLYVDRENSICDGHN